MSHIELLIILAESVSFDIRKGYLTLPGKLECRISVANNHSFEYAEGHHSAFMLIKIKPDSWCLLLIPWCPFTIVVLGLQFLSSSFLTFPICFHIVKSKSSSGEGSTASAAPPTKVFDALR